MTNDRPSDLLSALPRSRPHRRSEKRPARAAAPEPAVQETGEESKKAAAKSTRGAAKSSRGAARNARGGAQSTRAAAKSTRAQAKSTRADGNSTHAGAAPARTPARSRGQSERTAPPATAPRQRPRPLAQPAQPRGVPGGAGGSRPEPSTEFPVLRTAIQAAAELTEIGVTLSAKALRGAIGRLPRP